MNITDKLKHINKQIEDVAIEIAQNSKNGLACGLLLAASTIVLKAIQATDGSILLPDERQQQGHDSHLDTCGNPTCQHPSHFGKVVNL